MLETPSTEDYFWKKTLNLMGQICFLSVMEQIIFLLNIIHERILYKHAMEENVPHGMSFILHLNFVYQQTIQPTMTNGPMPHCLQKRREINLPIEGTKLMLRAIHLDVKWLRSALIFGHHNVKTRPPGGRTNKRFWTKANLSAYLRSCSCTGRLIDSVYLSAKNGNSVSPYPASWSDPLIFSKCHYAPMHMLFLGHVKSDIDMVSKWLARYEILATFGKQANMYLQAVRTLRANRYFAAHPFSTSSWGTGVWVSDNYLFWGRVMKFILILSALNQQRLIMNNEKYIKEIQMIKRFVLVAQVCLCRIMSTERVVADLQEIILLSMDAMVEIDGLLLNPNWMQYNDEFNNNDNDDHHMDYMTGNSDDQITTTIRKKRSPNFVKSNSLGLLVAANTHSYHGPATLNWEGGWHGEHKIQQVKPLLHIKRSNVDWQTITLPRLYQHKIIQRLLDDCMKQEQNENQSSRQMEGALKVYGSRQMAEKAINSAQPIIAVLDHKNVLYIPYRPIGRANTTRSSVDLMEIKCDDNEGTMIQNLCWVCPIHSTKNITPFESIYSIKSNFIKEFVLMLPTLNEDNGQVFINNY